ncbi:MAG TPA: 4,5-DOPA dioxygenase extradiol [Pyrinomonadaceae bacterium]
MQSRMPAIFIGHGNPLNALQQNDYTNAWRAIGQTIRKPRAILAVSAHWYVPGTFVTAMGKPRTIHDFGGFPEELYQVRYNAPGSPELASHVSELLTPIPVGLDYSWGLDHGTWSILCHVFPNADIPVVQLSIDETQPAPFHYKLARRLEALRDEEVLVVGSGNLVHNLHTYAWGKHAVAPFDWAVRFEEEVMAYLLANDHKPIIHYEKLGREALLAVPTPEHYLPLLYVIGVQAREDRISFPVKGVDGGSISMLAVQVG